MSVLSTTAGLANVFALGFHAVFANSLTVGNLRLADAAFDCKLTLHSINNNFQMKLTHAGNYCLASFVIGFYTEGGVFFSQTSQRYTHLFLVSFGFGFNSDTDWRFWKDNTFKQNWVTLITQGVSGCCAFKSGNSSYVASFN